MAVFVKTNEIEKLVLISALIKCAEQRYGKYEIKDIKISEHDLSLELNNQNRIDLFSLNNEISEDFNEEEILRIIVKENIVLSQHFTFDNDPKPLYKFISDKSKGLNVYFEGSVSFAKPTTMNDIYDSNTKFDINGITCDGRKYTRTLCLCENKDTEMMWGVYANSFNGFCFEYKLNDILKKVTKIPMVLYGAVDYNHTKKSIKYVVTNLNIKKCINELEELFYKDYSWKNEKEFRIILFKNNFNKCKKYYNYHVNYSNCFQFDKNAKIIPMTQVKKSSNTVIRYVLSKLYYLNCDKNETRWQKSKNQYRIPDDSKLIPLLFEWAKSGSNSDGCSIIMDSNEIKNISNSLLDMFFKDGSLKR